MIANFRLTQPVFQVVLGGNFHDEVYIDGKSYELLLEIQRILSIFEPIDDDEARKIWLEIPRGTVEEYLSFIEARYGFSENEDDDESRKRYQNSFKRGFPYETKWYFLVTSTYREHTFLKISDRDHSCIIFSNEKSYNRTYSINMEWFLSPLLKLVQERVSTIAKDVNVYNQYIENNLPYRQRSGTIKSKYLNSIIPEWKLQVEDRGYCIRVLKELIRREKIYTATHEQSNDYFERHNVPMPYDTMSIRRFCKFYRIADTIYWSKSESESANKTQNISDDVEYYTSYGLHYASVKDFDVESSVDFNKFAKDHYGELGFSRMNVRATNYYAGGRWLITFSISYSASVAEGLKIAIALYESGAPFMFYEADTLLHILEETSVVRIFPYTFHDYLKGGNDEGVIAIPYVEDCDKPDELTRAQFDEIVKLAVWEPDVKLKIDRKIPLNDKVYALIRDEAETPMTISEIRKRIEQKYDTYLAVCQKEGCHGYYYMSPLRNKNLSAVKCTQYYSSFNEAMKALIININMVTPSSSDNLA